MIQGRGGRQVVGGAALAGCRHVNVRCAGAPQARAACCAASLRGHLLHRLLKGGSVHLLRLRHGLLGLGCVGVVMMVGWPGLGLFEA